MAIAGDGAEALRVRQAAGERVIYLGNVPYRELPSLIARATASLIPKNNACAFSNSGLSPLKIYESLACGTPVIVSDFPGIADIVRETNTGLVIPCQDAGALARAVATLHHSPQLRQEMGARARQVAVENHSWDKRAADTLRVLEAVLAKGSSKSTLGTVPATDRPVTP